MTFVPAKIIKDKGKEYEFVGYINGNSSKDAKQEFRNKYKLPKGTALIVVTMDDLPTSKNYPAVYSKRSKYAVWQEKRSIKKQEKRVHKPSRFEGII